MNLLRNLFAPKRTGKKAVKSGRSRSANRMSCCEGSPPVERIPGTGCCGSSCAGPRTGCTASEPRIRTCVCQVNVGCLDRPDCGGFRPRGTAETGACPAPCQCEVEDSWNRNVPPKPNCEWVSNFTELRRQWSDHGRRETCKCCNCRPSRPSTPCRPCLPCPPVTPCCSSTSVSGPKRDPCKPPDACNRNCCEASRLGGGACQPCRSPNATGCCPAPSNDNNHRPPPNCCPAPPDCCSPACPPACPPPGCCPPQNCGPPDSPPPSSSSCQPCAPQPRPILKKRSCCLCAPGRCMCQPLPRSCNCPPPVQIDARADNECSCDCPSSPECACPPSEKRFSRTKVKCQNAKMCCPLPRLPPGPPCCCVECRPCLPPPCDPCSSSRCSSPTPKFKFCRPASPCPPSSPCRPQSPVRPTCRPPTPCSPCRKPSGSPCRSLARSSSRGSSCCSPGRAPGQSSSSWCDYCGEVEVEVGVEGCGDDEEAYCPAGSQLARCCCGPDGKGCADDCGWCCSRNCDQVYDPIDPGARSNDEQRLPSETRCRVRGENGEDDSFEFPRTALNTRGTPGAPGCSGSPGSKRFYPPTAGISAGGATTLPVIVRRTATPAICRVPIRTNALYSRLAARRRSGLGSHDVAAQPKFNSQ